MSSIIEGYNYDIFISYRLRDNKVEKWISEFVEALRTELESTFKEDISIYFDENPHDGLLETHDVDSSLKEKLKCLIFIPIISRIYCDPKAFAWVHEFKAFVETASNDQFGLKVTLPNGNVSTRVLPVRIYDLDPEDTHLCESLLGSVLRGVDFIYKSPGVNRPLRANEDHPQDNINKTYYRDQINKVANAISDILNGLKHNKTEPGKIDTGGLNTDIRKKADIRSRIKNAFQWQKFKKRLIFLISVLIILPAGYLIYRKVNLNNNDKSIALISLQNTTSDTALTEAANEFNLVLNQKLPLIKGFTMPSGYRTEKYLETEKSLNNIRKALKVNYILTGNIMRNNKEVTILFQLSETRDFKLLWNSPIVWNSKLVSKNTNEIVRSISNIMGVKITSEEEKKLDIELSGNPDDNLKILAANKKLNEAWDYYNYDDKVLDSRSFKTAIEAYDNLIKEDPSFALVYAKRAIALSFDFFLQRDSSDIERCKKDVEMALSIKKDLSEADIAQGFYYYYCLEQNEKALECFIRAAEKDPGNYKPLFYMALAYRRLGRWNDCLRLITRVIRMNPQEPLFLTNIGMTYMYLHKFDSAMLFQQRAIDLMPGWAAGYKNKFEVLMLRDGLTSESRNIIDAAIERTGDKMTEYRIRLKIYEKNYQDAFTLASRSDSGDYEIPGTKYIYLGRISSALKNSNDALKYYDSAKLVIIKALQKRPKSYLLHGLLGMAYAGLMDKKNAIDEAEEAINLVHSKNRMDESDLYLNLAQIHTMLGNYEDAYSRVAFLLNNPSDFSKKILLLDPVWKPLIDKPEFKKRIK